MKNQWLLTADGDYVRLPESFPSFPNAVSDRKGVLSAWLEASRVVPLWSREWKSVKAWQVGPRSLGDTMWFCFSNGKGECEVGRQRFSFSPGSLILVPKGAVHSVRLHSKGEIQQFTVHFQAYAYGGVNLLDLVGFPFYIPADSQGLYVEVSKQIARLFAVKPPSWNRLMSELIFQVLLHMVHNHGDLFHERGKGDLQPRIQRLLPALQMIENRLSDSQLTVRDLEEVLHVSGVYLRRIFNEVTGLSPIQFVQRRRIEYACLQLRQTQYTIAHIAELSGFNDVPYFYRSFHRWVKMTPLEYREVRKRDLIGMS